MDFYRKSQDFKTKLSLVKSYNFVCLFLEMLFLPAHRVLDLNFLFNLLSTLNFKQFLSICKILCYFICINSYQDENGARIWILKIGCFKNPRKVCLCIQLESNQTGQKRFYEAKCWFSREHITTLEYCHTSAQPIIFKH